MYCTYICFYVYIERTEINQTPNQHISANLPPQQKHLQLICIQYCLSHALFGTLPPLPLAAFKLRRLH